MYSWILSIAKLQEKIIQTTPCWESESLIMIDEASFHYSRKMYVDLPTTLIGFG